MAQRISENSGMSRNGGQDADGGGTDEDAHQRGDDRQAHGHDRAEGDEQHDDGDADTDQLAARCVLCQLGECAGELDLRRRRRGLVA